MSDIAKIAITGIVAAVCALTVRKQVPELSVLLAICAGTLILGYCVGAFSTVIEFMEKLTALGGMNPDVIAPVMKVTGVAVLSRISADFCRDAKETALAAAVETAGAAVALLAILPLMELVLELIEGLL